MNREVRITLRTECLFGEEEGVLPDGTPVTLGLLLKQWREDYAPYFERDLLLAMVRLVRSDEDAPGPNECFTLRWFRDGARLGRLEGVARNAMATLRAPDQEAARAFDLSASVRSIARAKAMPNVHSNGDWG